MSFPYIRYQLAHSFVAGDIHFDDDENYVNEHSRSSHGEDVMLRRVRAINIDTKGGVIDLPVVAFRKLNLLISCIFHSHTCIGL